MTGVVLVVSGVAAFVIAATVNLLPDDVDFLGLTSSQLCSYDGCRIVHFMSHDRVAWGSSMMAIGILYIWIAVDPIRQRKRWAWWTVLVTAVIGFGSFLTYLGYGYLDVYHAAASLPLLILLGIGLIGTYPHMTAPTDRLTRPRSDPVDPQARWGRRLLSLCAFGMVLGGLTILTIGTVRVFVPEDLDYIGANAEQLRQLNRGLVALIAHDREGFGGGIASTGIALLAIARAGVRGYNPLLWIALAAAGLVGFGGAIGVHFVVGYTSFSHLLPAYAGATVFLVSIALLFGPMCLPEQRRSTAATLPLN